MRVCEVFGPTIQGEGPSAGQRAMFIRLSGCNLDCRFCDTPFTWDWAGKNGVAYDQTAESHERSMDELISALADVGSLVVITGGEPLIQQRAVTELCNKLGSHGRRVEIETNGTITPNPDLLASEWVRFNVSPKLANSGVELQRRWRPDAIDAFGRSGRAAFKFVCRNSADVDEIAKLIADRLECAGNVWVMPEGQTVADVLSHTCAVTDAAIRHGFNVSTRLHVLAWGNERGR